METDDGLCVEESAFDVEMKLGIIDAMTRVLERTPFSSVTINQICDEAYISRPTFYRYFPNKDSVPIWHVNHFFRVGSFQIGRTLTWYEGHYVTLTGMAKSTLFYQRLELPNGCIPLRQYSTKAHADNLRETLVKFKGISLTDRLEFQVETFAKTRTDITKKWIYGGLRPEPSIFAEYTNSIVPPELFFLLNEPANKSEGMQKLDSGS